MHTMRLLGAMLALGGTAVTAAPDTTATDEPTRLVLRNARLTLALGKTSKGAVESLVDNATRVEFIAPAAAPRLFQLVFTPRGQPNGERLTVTSTQADTFTGAVETAETGHRARLVHDGYKGQAIRVECVATVTAADPLVRWRLSVSFPESLMLEEILFPCVSLHAPLSGTGADDAAVLGLSKGGVVRRPHEQKTGQRVAGSQPGSLAAQFACYHGESAGFYTAAYDSIGRPKQVELRRTAEGAELLWNPHAYNTSPFALEFDIVQTTFAGTGSAKPDWRDAADIYKAWALAQPWCARTYDQRPDIPAWMKAGPAMVRFNRRWLANPATIDDWLAKYWQAHFPDVPLITAYWGWEKIESWVTPDYFPLFPSDEQFTALVARTRQLGCHAFPWPSGYHWTLTFDKQADGSFRWDDRKRFDEIARPHAISTRAGQLYTRAPSWLRGGETSCMCPGDPWTIAWWNNDISVPLAQRGCELVQVDQVVGGAFPACFATGHAHAPGPGPWMTDVFTRQLQTMFEACRRVEPDSVVCFEEPNERFNHLVGIQDYRDCESPLELASVFNYIYHEFLPTFQSNPRAGDTIMLAYCLVNGQMPHFVPHWHAVPGPALANGDFEAPEGPQGFAGWERLAGYQGRDYLGKASPDTVEKHGGNTSLRLENAADSDVVQVSQNVVVDSGLEVGRRYRLSAWTKTESMARDNAIGFGTFTSETKSTHGGGRIPFAAPGAGWTQGAAEFTVPPGTAFLRIMIHIEGPAKAWADDLIIEEVRADGTTAVAMTSGLPPEHRLMEQWIRLFHGEGKPYLLFGRMLHPPPLVTATTSWHGKTVPAVLHNAFRASDGTEAVILANGTGEKQAASLTWQGREQDWTLEPQEVRLLR